MKNPNTKRNRLPGRAKGRAVDPIARDEVLEAIDGISRTADQLIECLHRLQDAHGYLSSQHLVALADVLRLAPTEVYEVATFYHHFDVVREGETPPPPSARRLKKAATYS